MKYKWLTAAVFLIVLAAVLLGCKKPQVLDGPGMINNQPWKGFTLSHTDGTRYYFRFVVKESDFGFLLTGECRDENGDLHVLEEGVELSAEDLQFLRDLWLGDLPDAVSSPDDRESVPADAPDIKLMLTWVGGTQQEKVLPEDTSILLYSRFLHYFIHQ